VQVQEDVALDPGIGAVEIEAVVVAAGDNIFDEMDDRVRAIAAGEIDDIIVAGGLAEEVAQEQAVPVAADALGAMARLKRRRGSREIAVADDEAGAVQVDVGSA